MTARNNRESRTRTFPATGLGLLVPPMVWALLFVALYSVQGAYCAGAGAGSQLLGVPLMRLAMAVLVIVASVTIILVGLKAWGRHRRPDTERDENDASSRETSKVERFLLVAVMLNAGLFLVASLWVGVPVVLMPPC